MADFQFDAAAARADGVSDADIAAFLAPRAGFDLARARKDGVSDAAIIDFLAPEVAGPPASAAPPKPKATIGDDLQRGLEQARSSAQTLGGIIAGARLSDIEAAKAKRDRGEYLPPIERAMADQYDEAKANAQRQFGENVGKGIEHRQKAEALPISPEYKAFKDSASQGVGAALRAFWKAPGEVLTSILAEGAVATAPGLAAAVAGGPVAGTAVAGGQAFLQAYSDKVVDLLAKKGVNVDDKAAVMAALSDPAIADEIKGDASLAAIPQAAAAGASMAIGARTLAPASLATRPIAQQAVNIPAQAAAQGVLSAAGEAGSSAAIGEPIEGGKVAIAGISGASQGPVDVAAFAAHRGISAVVDRPRAIAADVMAAPTVDDAIAKAQAVVSQPVDVPTETANLREFGGPAERQQADLLDLFGGLNAGIVERTDQGTYHYRTPEGENIPLRVVDPATAPPNGSTLTPSLAAAQREHYGKLGVDVVYFADDAGRIPFDGAVDPQHPDTLFLSANPERNAEQVAAHEFTHILESTKLPDGANLGDILHAQIRAGLTEEGYQHALDRFEATAPQRQDFPEGPEGTRDYVDARISHFVRELGADIGGEAPRFQSFLPRVVDAVQERYGADTAKGVLQKLIAGIQQTMRTLRAFFSRPSELAEYGQPPTVSQTWVTNLDEIHGTLAKMYAERFGTAAEKENARLAEMREAAQRARGERPPLRLEAPALVTPPPPRERPPITPENVFRPETYGLPSDTQPVRTPFPEHAFADNEPVAPVAEPVPVRDNVSHVTPEAAGAEVAPPPVAEKPQAGPPEQVPAPRPVDQAPAPRPEPTRVESKPASPDVPVREGFTQIGRNRDGKMLYEDARGVRSYLERGVRVSEPVGIKPGSNEISVDRSRAEWQVAEPHPDRPDVKVEYEKPKEGDIRPPKNEPVSTPLTEERGATPDHALADDIARTLARPDHEISATGIQKAADTRYGGTLAEGKYTRDQLYDAMELGVNRFIQQHPDRFTPAVEADRAKATAADLAALKDRLPTQTVRAGEKDAYQQFSTPPDYAYAANWVANIGQADHVLEPSAGVGGLLVHAMNAGARETTANELSDKRRGMIEALKPSRITGEDAAQLHNILPNDVRPTVVVMNPPFSRAAERMGGRMVLDEGAKHIEQALQRLEPGGRLVAIVGDGMKPEGTVTPGGGRQGTGAVFAGWWKRIGAEYDVRANVGVDRDIYRKYGTSFPTRFLVIDKVSPSGRPMVTGQVPDAAALIEHLKEVRNERPGIERVAGQQGRPDVAAGGRSGPERGGELSRPTGAVGPERGSDRGDATPVAEPAVAAGGREPGGRPVPDGQRADAGGEPVDRVEPQPADRGADAEPGGSAGGSGEPGGRGASGAGSDLRPDGSGERAEPGVTPAPEAVLKTEAAVTEPDNKGLTEAIYESYKPQRVKIAGSKAHPGALVQSAAMATVMPPRTDYVPKLPAKLVKDGLLSDAQLEAVTYAGHAHSDVMANGKRRGFFIGDGTGVGKGREIAGILLDNKQQGRTRAVWISEKPALINDAKRDWSGLLQPATDIFAQSKVKAGDDIKAKSGILFTTYDTLKSAEQTKVQGEKVKGRSRVDQIVAWLGEDFDGVIAFDEAHALGNSTEQKGKRGKKDPAKKALAGVELQDRLPNARVVYVSATGATDVNNLAYVDRLGLWGEGTPFPDRKDFVEKVTSGGVAAMELVARDMKALGHYIARNLSYDGVEYDKVEHKLSRDQRQIYDKLAEGWQVVLQNIEAALEITGGTKNGKSTGAQQAAQAKSAFWGAHQRFFNQVITSMQMPSVLKGIEADLKAGRQAVLQLVNTNEAAQDRAIEKARAAGEGEIEDLDMTPRDQLMQLVEKSFPVQQMEEYLDDKGNIRSRPAVDSKGNPVLNKRAIAMREALLNQLGSLRVPQGPLEMLFDKFGTDMVAEVTGRSQRVVRAPDQSGELKTVVEKRGAQSSIVDAEAFQAGKKKILVFSQAGGTGRSYHAALGSGAEKARRSHYLVQGGWRADAAVQGFGRTHRTSQASAPIFHLVTTDLQGQKRFISSIARRLGQLGALTKGERRTGDQGMFGMRDNLESTEAREGLTKFIEDVVGGKVEGVTTEDIQKGMGLKLYDAEGKLVQPKMETFLNRVLSLKVDDQNRVFEAFSQRMDDAIDRAAAAGTLDAGVETYKADKINKAEERTVFTDPRSGAETKYVRLETLNRNHPVGFEDTLAGRNKTNGRKPTEFVRNEQSGNIFAVTEANDRTTATGEIIPQTRLTSPTDYQFVETSRLRGENWKTLTVEQARPLWEQQVARTPEYRKSDLHLITGAVLPIWDRLGGSPAIYRLQTDAGERMLGRVIPSKAVDATLRRLGAEGAGQARTPEEIADRLLAGATATLANDWKIRRSRVAGENRLELIGPDYRHEAELGRHGVFVERIAYTPRYFIPTDRAATAIEAITKNRPVTSVEDPGGARFSPRSDASPFFSALTRGVEALKVTKATPGQWEATIRNMPGVKPEERAWVGVDDWLRRQPKGVTKEEVLDYLRANEVQVREVEKGGVQVSALHVDALDDFLRDVEGLDASDARDLAVRAGRGDRDAIDEVEALGKGAQGMLEPFYQTGRSATEYSNYTLPGGENYRELLLTLPPREGEPYRSSHWQEPNVLAHVRFDDRTGPNGERILHVAEVQSDWHQQGRKVGYKSGRPPEGLRAEDKGGYFEVVDRDGKFVTNVYASDAATPELAITEAQRRLIEQRRRTGFEDGKVPDAPFKTTWPELAFKRVLRYAAENGYDRVTWDTGATNAERYDLSRQVNRIEWNGDGENDRIVTLQPTTGNDIEFRVLPDGKVTGISRLGLGSEFDGRNIADVVGKEIGEKIISERYGRLSGDGLRIGGEGMNAFYDKQLPLVANKLGKKFGAKVEDSEVNAEAPMNDAFVRALEEETGEPEQLSRVTVHSIAITPSMREGVMRGQPLFSPRITGENRTRTYTPEQEAAFERVGRTTEPTTFRQRLDNVGEDLGRKVLRGAVDAYIGLKRDDPKGYMAARLANSVAGAQEVFRLYGTLKFDGMTYNYKDLNGGVRGLVRELGPEATDFLWWVAGHRAERLTAEDRENLFTADDIRAMKELNRGDLDQPYVLPNGTATTKREVAYADALRRYDILNKSVTDLVKKSGLVSEKAVDELWADPFYVPFFREAATEGSTRFAAPSSSMVKQYASKRLKGGSEKLRTDLWENAFGNWDHMIDAALRNRAAVQILDTARQLGAAEMVSDQRYNHQMSKAEKAETTWAMVDGKKQYWRVIDPMVFAAVSSLGTMQKPGPIMAVAKWFAQALRYGVTANPLFAVRNLIRDTENSIAVSEVSKNPFRNLADGFDRQEVGDRLENVARAVLRQEARTLRIDPEKVSAMAGGALMRLGTGADDGIAKTDLGNILDTPGRIRAFGRYLADVAGAYKDVLAAGEDVNRMALYSQLRKEGASHDFASFSARDLQDFTLKGGAPFVQTLTQIIPFLNSRAQGLYKIGRSAADADRSIAAAVGGRVARNIALRTATVLGAMTLAGLGLDAIYHDDEDYKKRTEYDRQTYYWFKIGDATFRIPKGFELAALSSLATDGIEAFFSKEMTGERLVNSFWQSLATNLQVQAPAIAQPIIDVATNTRATGGPIETMGMERLLPEQRYRGDNTLVARGISSALNSGLRAIAPRAEGPSTAQVDYLVNAYGAWLATSVMGMADTVVRAFADEPERPSRDFWARATQGLVETGPRASSRYVDMLYEQGKKVEQAYATYLDLVRRGDAEGTERFVERHRDDLMRHGRVSGAMRTETRLNQAIRAITDSRDPSLTPERKRLQIMELQAAKSRAAEQVFGASP